MDESGLHERPHTQTNLEALGKSDKDTHHTISEDQTSAAYSKQRLLAARDLASTRSEASLSHAPKKRRHVSQASRQTYSSFSRQTSSTQSSVSENKKNEDVKEEEEEEEEGEEEDQAEDSSSSGPTILGNITIKEKLGLLELEIQRLDKNNSELEERNQELEKEIARSKECPAFYILHCIRRSTEGGNYANDSSDSDVEENHSFLTKPSWGLTQGSLRLKGASPLGDPEAYIRRSQNLAFVVYNFYFDNHRVEDAYQALSAGKALPDPEPLSQEIRVISSTLEEALECFLADRLDIEATYLITRSNLQAPYLWWYDHRAYAPFVSLMPEHETVFNLLTGWIEENYSALFDQADAHMKRRLVTNATMPFIYRCGDILVSRETGSLKAYRIQTIPCEVSAMREDETSIVVQRKELDHTWRMKCCSYEFNGSAQEATRWVQVRLPAHTEHDEVDSTTLQYVPLKYLDAKIHETLRKRGQTFWACRKKKLISYKGNDAAKDHAQRFIIDFETYQELHLGTLSRGEPDEPLAPRQIEVNEMFERDEPPEEPHLLLWPDHVFGFDLRYKKWKNLQVDKIQEVTWNTTAFDNLVIDAETKELVKALVTSQISTDRGTDIIANKGNGLIMLLHGSPGTGKTFTAESVAEMANKPLYPVTCGDIGTEPEKVEHYLESVIHLGKIWDCVVLLDEAEVFLEQRTLTDLARNALVSVFLRALEYFDGILILTSNRVGTFDEAFKSRIQLALHYEPLGVPQRRQIWRNFFTRLEGMGETLIDFIDIERHIDNLAEYNMNGRQIRNAITTARQLAQYKQTTMRYMHLRHSIEVSGKFDRYLETIRHGEKDDEIAREEGYR